MSKDFIEFPELIEFNDYGNYNDYEEALLEVYEADLWKGGLTFNGLRVVPRVHKRFELNGKSLDWTFVHFTSRGEIEEDRDLDMRRCERIGWVKPIIENAHLDCVKVWVNERKDRNGKNVPSIVFWCEEVNSKVVITKRVGKKGEYYTITTFYLINSVYKIKKHNDEYEAYVKENGEFNIT
ncbi:hypothetical protein N9V96_01655 [Polaribacter sp.]|nr:hypothetical protein [Polaribacter sp.]